MKSSFLTIFLLVISERLGTIVQSAWRWHKRGQS